MSTVSFPPPTETFADVCAVSLDRLITAYRASIDLLRRACKKEIIAHKTIEKADPHFGDDLFILRFVLSHHKKGVAKAKGFLLKCIEWRAKYADMLAPLRGETLAASPFDAEARMHLPGGLHFCTADGHPLFVIRNGVANPHAPVGGPSTGGGGLTAEQLGEWFVLTKECAHAYCDAKTRELNRLIKVCAIQDFKGVSMRMFNRTFMNALASSSHTAETIYPQLLKRSVIVNLPTLLRHITSLTLKLMPLGLQEKIGICPESDPAKTAQYISNELNIPTHDLPTFLGGECNCVPHGCINNTPNEYTGSLTIAQAKQLSIDSWKDYVTYRLGQPPVSFRKGFPFGRAEMEMKMKGLDVFMVNRDGEYSGFGYVSTIHPNYQGPAPVADLFPGSGEDRSDDTAAVSSPISAVAADDDKEAEHIIEDIEAIAAMAEQAEVTEATA